MNPESGNAKFSWIKKLQDTTDRYLVPTALDRPEPFAVAFLVVVLASWLDVHFQTLRNSPNLAYMSAVVFSAWYGGLGPSILAIVLAVLAEDYFLLDPVKSINFYTGDLPPLLAFTISGLLVSSLVSALKRRQQLLSEIALYDPLTNLPNRRLFDDRLELAMSVALRAGEKLAIVFLDIDHFKSINDANGHRVGDLVLKKIAEKIRTSVRKEDTISRWGGDEFVILFPEIKKVDDAIAVMDKIFSEFTEPISVEGKNLQVEISAGISIYPDNGMSRSDLVRSADDALYVAKQSGRNQYRFASN